MKSAITVSYKGDVVTTIDIDHSSQKKFYTFGRSTKNDVFLQSAIVSNEHLVFEVRGDQVYVRDLNSTNGMFINGEKQPSAVLNNGDVIRIDDLSNNHNEGVMFIYSLHSSNIDEKWLEYSLREKTEVTIGREDSNEIVIVHSLVSRQHAMIEKLGSHFYIEDFKSTNGTFLNGKRVTGKQKLEPLDTIFIGSTKLIFHEDKIIYNVESSGLRLDAIHISKFVEESKGFLKPKQPKTILDDISIGIKAGELVSIIGGSGAGKSTFMDALNGFRLPTEGSVLINDDDFYENYEAYKNIIGYVPQQDIVYDTLSVEDMLTYAARLRMPEDSTEEEIQARVDQVIRDVELEGREDVLIKQLSGGQRKRASIAVELLADPKLFFLDEPTSGLDPGMERNMMQLLRKLSNQGKTIILITHATANLMLCDKVVILGFGGKLCYFGPPSGSLQFFGVKDYADIYDCINKHSSDWQMRFKQSEYYSYFKPLEVKTPKPISAPEVADRSSMKQFSILCKRYLKLTLADKQRSIVLLLQAPFIAFVLLLVVSDNPIQFYESSKELIFTIASTGVWIGLLNSIQEITKENDIYRRERAVNLKLIPYISSKLIILGVLSFVQAVLFVAILTQFITLPTESLLGSIRLELMITLFLTTFAATTLGLVISSMVSNSDRAMGIAPYLLIPQLILNGLVFKLEGAAEVISNLAISKWAARAIGISFDLNSRPLEIEDSGFRVPQRDLPEYFDYELSLLYQNWMILVGVAVICIIASIVSLKLKDN
ncbi:ABC transporter permease [Anaerobacillus alkalidiazotrophicus]|uniref:ABC transporter permease n=2 Tax=Anaerobacillus alkalidiazotrophicus TaxID=472963 RepID=A0A1S2MCK5_9BACI|nr:ABC transporter permease [Anaerobacillus alkalidiazotrophicus]